MSVYTQNFKLKTRGFCDLQDVTAQVQDAVDESGVQAGIVCVIVTGSTAAVTTLEFEPNLVEDFCELMEKLIPKDLPTRHGKTWGDDNGFSHLRASLVGSSISVPIEKRRLQLGNWQQIVVCDFDNRTRQREVMVQIVGE